jgi:hypothetical protein
VCRVKLFVKFVNKLYVTLYIVKNVKYHIVTNALIILVKQQSMSSKTISKRIIMNYFYSDGNTIQYAKEQYFNQLQISHLVVCVCAMDFYVRS